MQERIQQMLKQQKQLSLNDTYIALILEEDEKLYNKLTTKLRVIAATAS